LSEKNSSAEDTIIFHPIAFVENSRDEVIDDNWGAVISDITLVDTFPEDTLDGIDDFSYLYILFYFHRADKSDECRSSRHPRDNPVWPITGVFAMRGKDRPNHIGLTIVELLGKEERTLRVRGLDAVNGSPVLDIKPVIREYMPTGDIKQPAWVAELMKDYWRLE